MENLKEKKTFRHSAGFGKRMEHWIIGNMLKEGLDVYIPLVDDFGIDAVIRKPSGHFIEVQIKARSIDVKLGSTGLFAAISHDKRENYYFLFYSERLDITWVLSSEDFLKESYENKSGKNEGKHSIHLNGTRTDKVSKQKYEYPKDRYNKYVITDFNIFK